MKCPVDQADLLMTAREGVEIDYCPQCRGVWMDRGELDKIIERSADELDRFADDRGRPDREPDRGYREREHEAPRHKRKKGWLGEMFEFGE